MPDLQDGETAEMQGSGAKPYVLKNTGGVYSCSCPAWRNPSIAIEQRTCKHLRKLRGDEDFGHGKIHGNFVTNDNRIQTPNFHIADAKI